MKLCRISSKGSLLGVVANARSAGLAPAALDATNRSVVTRLVHIFVIDAHFVR